MRALIVDDERHSHKVLKELLTKDHPDMEVVGSAFSVTEGLELVEKHQPELVFLDVELPDGLGFDLVKQIGEPDFQIIFITSFDKYAISAIRFGALDFLVKPIDETELADALHKAHKSLQQKISPDQIAILLEAYEKAKVEQLPKRLAIVSQSETIYLDVADIMYMTAQQVFTLFYLKDAQQEIVATINLGKYVKQFAAYPHFQQIYRSHLINLNFVKSFRRGDRTVVMTDGTELRVSRGFLDDFLRGMEGL